VEKRGRFFIAVAASILFFCASIATAQEISLMTWNIDRAIGAGTNIDNSGALAVARIVEFLQPDVLFLNEVLSRSNNIFQSTATVNEQLRNWVIANVPYLGTGTFYSIVATNSDGFIRNAIVSRYPLVSVTNYNDGLRGLLSATVDIPGTTNDLGVFLAHLKAFGDLTSSSQRQAQANFDANIIRNWLASTNLAAVFAGDFNEDEGNPQFPLNSNVGVGLYAPISTNLSAGLFNFNPFDTNAPGSNQTISIRGALTRRFDYILPSTGRYASIEGFVFNSFTWFDLGLLPPWLNRDDSETASDHLAVFAKMNLGPLESLQAIPEPSILFLFLAGGAIIIGYNRAQKRRR
jgi:endonuclease/exonuclease/phosphatase family metal-dependent hydrolase